MQLVDEAAVSQQHEAGLTKTRQETKCKAAMKIWRKQSRARCSNHSNFMFAFGARAEATQFSCARLPKLKLRICHNLLSQHIARKTTWGFTWTKTTPLPRHSAELATTPKKLFCTNIMFISFGTTATGAYLDKELHLQRRPDRLLHLPRHQHSLRALQKQCWNRPLCVRVHLRKPFRPESYGQQPGGTCLDRPLSEAPRDL